MTKRNVLIIGATGKVGSAALKQLSNYERINVIAGVRNMQKATHLIDSGAELVKLDLDDATSIQIAVKSVDSLLLLTGYSVDMLKQSKRVVDAAKSAGVKHIVHVGASGNPTSEVAHWGWHRMVEAYIEQQGFSYTHLQPEAFMQNITAFGWFNQDSLTNLIKNATWSWVDAHDVGALAGEALANPDQFHNQTWQLGYALASMPQVASMLARALNKAITTKDLAPETFYLEAIKAGADPAYMACVRDQFVLNGNGAIADADRIFDTKSFHSAVGRLPNSWQEFIAREFKENA